MTDQRGPETYRFVGWTDGLRPGRHVVSSDPPRKSSCAATTTIHLLVTFMNANKKLKMMTTNEPSFPTGSAGGETHAATNQSDTVTPESNAWATMQRWENEIVTPGGSSFFNDMIPTFLEKSEVKTVQDIKNKSNEWFGLLAICGVNTVSLKMKLDKVKIAEADSVMVPVGFVTPESNAWETMKLWMNDIVTPGGSSFFIDMIPIFLEKSEVKTVQDIKNKSINDDNWFNSLTSCGVNTFSLKMKLNQVKFAQSDIRMVPVDYEIINSELSHTADLQALRKKVYEMFDWYSSTPDDPTTANDPTTASNPTPNAQATPNDPPATETRPKCVAPYFPIIQSSGMGKTKLLHELGSLLNEEGTKCHLILPGAMTQVQEKVFWKLNFSQFAEQKEAIVGIMDLEGKVAAAGKGEATDKEENIDDAEKILTASAKVLQFLDDMILPKEFEEKPKRLVLMFDEAQLLLKENFGVKGFLFQCIRLWLRETDRDFKTVAIFAGTTSSLVNFFPSEKLESSDIPSRGGNRTFHKAGTVFPSPFFQTTTIGCFRFSNMSAEMVTNGSTEYDAAVPYGRPLFAIMSAKKELEIHLETVLSRMLLQKGSGWKSEKNACFSILATRVQMGQTSYETASLLVSQGYANLVGFSDLNVAQICFFTDPVCARLAMAMMDEEWLMKVRSSTVKGESKQWWVKQAAASFSGGLCKPNKGNVGEIFVALYLLLCGDTLRKGIDPTYRCFSVPLDSWVSNLMKSSTEKASIAREDMDHDAPSVSFIQICRNYLRSYIDYKFVVSQSLLKHLYESGTAFYAFPDCPDFDIVAAIRYTINKKGDPETFSFAPLLISVKAKEKFSPGDATLNCQAMEQKLKNTNCHRGVGLVVVIGSSYSPDDKLRKLKTSDITGLFDSSGFNKAKVIAKVLRIPIDDQFGISRALIELTSAKEEFTEIFSSHDYVCAHATDSQNPLSPENAMRSEKMNWTRSSCQFLSTLIEQLGKVNLASKKG
jgi:hypothetical protein